MTRRHILISALRIGTALLNVTQIARKACHLRGRKSATGRLIFTGAMKKGKTVKMPVCLTPEQLARARAATDEIYGDCSLLGRWQ